MTYVLGLSGSPRREGNTETLLDASLNGARSAGARTSKIILNELTIAPCQECGGCDMTGVCTVRDDMDTVYREVDLSDGIIVASPVYFSGVSAQTKAMIDRFQARWMAKYVLKKAARAGRKKRGVFICAGGSTKEDFFLNARQVISVFFKTIDVTYAGDLYCGGVEGKGAITRKEGALDKAFMLGKALVEGIG